MRRGPGPGGETPNADDGDNQGGEAEQTQLAFSEIHSAILRWSVYASGECCARETHCAGRVEPVVTYPWWEKAVTGSIRL